MIPNPRRNLTLKCQQQQQHNGLSLLPVSPLRALAAEAQLAGPESLLAPVPPNFLATLAWTLYRRVPLLRETSRQIRHTALKSWRLGVLAGFLFSFPLVTAWC